MRWRRELAQTAIVAAVLAVVLAVCGLLGDKVGVGPYP